MRKLIYEDINLKTKVSYEIHRWGTSRSDVKYLVFETDRDGNRKFVGEFSEEEAYKLVRVKCK